MYPVLFQIGPISIYSLGIFWALGALAAAGMGNLGLRLIYPEVVDLGLLTWHIGGIFVLSALAAVAGRAILNWQSVTGVFQNSGK